MGHLHRSTREKIARVVEYLKKNDPKGEGVKVEKIAYDLLDVVTAGKKQDPANAARNLGQLLRAHKRGRFVWPARGVVALLRRRAFRQANARALAAPPVPLSAVRNAQEALETARPTMLVAIACAVREVARDVEAGRDVLKAADDLIAFGELLKRRVRAL